MFHAENAEDQERTFQRFLQRGVSENGRSPSTNPPVPLPRHNTFHSGWLATDYRPSNLPSRASAPTRDQNSALKTMQSSKGRSPEKSEITADESSIQNGGLFHKDLLSMNLKHATFYNLLIQIFSLSSTKGEGHISSASFLIFLT